MHPKLIRSGCSLLCAALLLSSCGDSVAIHTPTAIVATPYPTATRLALPTHIPLNSPIPQGDQLFLSDYDTGIIARVDLSTQETTVIVTGLSKPEDGTCNAKGQIFFAETSSGRILRFNADGGDQTTILDSSQRTPEGQQFTPEGPSFDTSGNLFFNTAGAEFDVYPHSGAYRIIGGDPGNKPERIILPFTQHGEGTVFLPTGEFLVTDWTGGRIIESVPPRFGFGRVFASGIRHPLGIASRSDGDVFVSEGDESESSLTGDIFHLDSKGNLLGVFKTLDAVPRHMEFDADDNLYVGTITGGVFKITPKGLTTRIAKGRHVSGLAICKVSKGH